MLSFVDTFKGLPSKFNPTDSAAWKSEEKPLSTLKSMKATKGGALEGGDEASDAESTQRDFMAQEIRALWFVNCKMMGCWCPTISRMSK